MTYHLQRMTPTMPDAARRLQAIGRTTFAATFEQDNDPTELARYLDEAFTTEKMQAELQNPASLIYLLTDDARRDVGYLKLNLAAAFSDEVDLPNDLELQRIYLLPETQGQGAGQILFDEALRVAREQGCAGIWLGVWEHNARALAFYRKRGFTQFGAHTFMFGNEPQTDLLLRLPLT